MVKTLHTKTIISGLTIILSLSLVIIACYGNDLDDGIPMDDQPMSGFDNVNRDTNITYIKMRAKAKAEQAQNSATEAVVSNGQFGSINSAISGPGSTVNGDIIIIDESKGNKTIVVDN